jgi:hypothetical protein
VRERELHRADLRVALRHAHDARRAGPVDAARRDRRRRRVRDRQVAEEMRPLVADLRARRGALGVDQHLGLGDAPARVVDDDAARGLA